MSGLALGRSVGPAFQHSETNSAAAWRTAADHQKATWPAADWWHGFGSSQLDELLVAAGSMGRCNTICGNVDFKRWCVWHKQGAQGLHLSRWRSYGGGGKLGSR